MKQNKDVVKDYNTGVEDLFIKFFLTDPELFIRCRSIIQRDHYSDKINQKVIDFLNEHADKHSTLPTVEQVSAITGKSFELLDNIHDSHKNWFLEEYETFARHKQLENVILESPDLLVTGRYGEVEQKVKNAVSIALVKDLGTDYFGDPLSRLNAIKDRKSLVSTGMKDLDAKLYGGFERGALNIFAGQSGAGKSIFLQNIGLNWAIAGLNVVYLSLELSENLCSMRIDSMNTGIDTKEVLRRVDDVAIKVIESKKKTKGSLRIKQLPNGCTANDIRSYIKEYEIQTGLKVDAIMLDYLDLCMPISKKVSPSDLFVKDKYVSEELRNLAVELQILLVTASQLNRNSHESVDFGHEHISGGISKINTADNVIAIFTTQAMRENGRYQIQFLKTRSSSGVGQKVDLAFDQRTLRLSDLDPEQASALSENTRSVIDKLRADRSLDTPNNKDTHVQKTPVIEQKPVESMVEKSARLRNLLSGNR